jgi:hypothetical protein
MRRATQTRYSTPATTDVLEEEGGPEAEVGGRGRERGRESGSERGSERWIERQREMEGEKEVVPTR